MNKESLYKCPLFEGLDENETASSFDFFESVEKSYKKGDMITDVGSKLERFGLVLDGSVQVYTLDIDGSQMIMANIVEGETFGESLCFLRENTQIFACALTDCTVLWLGTDGIRSHDGSLLEKKLVNRFIALLAKRALAQNERIQILSKVTIREKLTAFFTEAVHKYGSYSFTLPLNRTDMAIYLGCDRCALSRELSKMKSEGLITYNKNKFEVKKKREFVSNYQK